MNIPTPFPQDAEHIHIELFKSKANEHRLMPRPNGDGARLEHGRGEPPDDQDAADLPYLSAASFAGKAVPPRRWIVRDLIPDRNVTLLSGDGAAGKGILSLLLCVAVSARTRWLGMETETGPALFLTAEDEVDELHRRLDAIAVGEGLDLASLADLHICGLAEQDAVMAAPVRKSSLIAPTPIWRGLLKLVAQHKPKLVVLDTLADVFGGNEIVRAEARQFIAMLRRLALAHDLAVVLIAHPSLSSMNSGSGTSGSTGWSNSVRSRLYLDGIKDEKGSVIDHDLRLLSVKKTNYGPPGLELRLRWTLGRFVAVEGQGKPTGFDKIARDAKAERVFLDLLAAFAAQGRSVSDSPGANYAPSAFANQGAEPMTKAELKGAMDRLLFARRIRVETFGSPSRQRKRIVVAAQEEKDA